MRRKRWRRGGDRAIVRSCSLLLSRMMASRPSCRDLSLIRWDLVFLLSKVLTTLQCTTTSKQVWDLAWRTQTATFSSPAAQTRRPSARLTSLKARQPREIRTLGVPRKVELRLQRADKQQTKKTKNNPRRPRTRRRKGMVYII